MKGKCNVFLLCIMLLLTAIAANATQVWDGKTKELWTKGSGTESDPYLIETPANLAYLAAQVNAGNTYKDTYFLQTGNIDLNGKSWTSIGSSTSAVFSGHYDGGNKLVVDAENYIFGYIQSATIQNITIAGASTSSLVNVVQNNSTLINCYNKSQSTLTSVTAGIVQTVTGTGGTFINCGNYANIKWQKTNQVDYIGGCFGKISGNAVIKRCFNYGNIDILGTSIYVGGIVGSIISSTIECCFNQGDIVVTLTMTGSWGAKGEIGGLAGSAGKCTILHSYNTGNLSADIQSQMYVMSCIGGITTNSSTEYAATIKGCYVAGTLNYDDSKFNAVAIGNTEHLEQCFCPISYIAQLPDDSNVRPLSQSEMKSPSFVSLLNTDGDYFYPDYTNINDGYPILRWQLEGVDFYTVKGLCREEQGTVTGTGAYPKGAEIQLTATPKDNFVFAGWSDGVTDNPRTVKVEGEATYAAQFERTSYTVYVQGNRIKIRPLYNAEWLLRIVSVCSRLLSSPIDARRNI